MLRVKKATLFFNQWGTVSFAGRAWEVRFDGLIHQLPNLVLPDNVYAHEECNVWQRANLWILDAALQNKGSQMTMIVLCNGSAGIGEGGTAHMAAIAKQQMAAILHIDTVLL